MPQCPQCNKKLVELSRRCPSCMADLDLLVDYVGHLQGGLERAENLTRAGELGQAVWAYLEVLEVDPDNVPARRQVGQVATAVRQFDRSAPGRRWLTGMRGWLLFDPAENRLLFAMHILLVAVLMFIAFSIGWTLGSGSAEENPDDALPAPQHIEKTRDTLMGK
jgi:hypothetical protein